MFPALQVRALQLPSFSFYMPTSWKLDDAAEHVYHLLDLELLSCCSNSKYRDWFRLRDWESTFWRRFGFARCLPACALLWSRLDVCVLDLESCKYQVDWMEYSTWRWQLDVPTFHGWNVGANGLYYTFLRLQVVVTYDFAVPIGFHHRWTDYILNICIFQNGVDFTWEWTSYKIIFSRNANVLNKFSEAAGLKHRNSKRLYKHCISSCRTLETWNSFLLTLAVDQCVQKEIRRFHSVFRSNGLTKPTRQNCNRGNQLNTTKPNRWKFPHHPLRPSERHSVDVAA